MGRIPNEVRTFFVLKFQEGSSVGCLLKVPTIGEVEASHLPSISLKGLGQQAIATVDLPKDSLARCVGVQDLFSGVRPSIAPYMEVHIHGLHQLVSDLSADVLGLGKLRHHLLLGGHR